MPNDITEHVYDFITIDDEGRTCEAIPESACQQAPRNFVLNTMNGSVTKLAEQLASPGMVFPWLLTALGAPGAMAGLLAARATLGGILTLMAGLAIRVYVADSASVRPYLFLIAAAAVLWAIGGLGIFVIANGAANIFSSPISGRFADRSSRTVMTISGLIASGICRSLPEASEMARS